MVNGQVSDTFLARDLGVLLPARRWQRRRKMGNWRDDLHEVAGSPGKMRDSLVNENPQQRLIRIWKQTRERQDAHAQRSPESDRTTFPLESAKDTNTPSASATRNATKRQGRRPAKRSH